MSDFDVHIQRTSRAQKECNKEEGISSSSGSRRASNGITATLGTTRQSTSGNGSRRHSEWLQRDIPVQKIRGKQKDVSDKG